MTAATGAVVVAGMTMEDATQEIITCLQAMKERYGAPVFDEWTVLSMAGGSAQILAYFGPRLESFQAQLAADLQSLKPALQSSGYQPGDFAFSRDAAGTHYDAFILLGAGHFLFCNHTEKTMEDISKNSRWLGAQEPFVSLAERFREDPLGA